MATKKKASTKEATIGINISVDANSVRELRDAILAILGTEVDQATMQIALNVLHDSCRISGANISNCSVSFGE